MITRGDRQRLERLSPGVLRTVTFGHEIGLTARGRNKAIAERADITDRSVRRHCATARLERIHMPKAPVGRPPRTSYAGSRRGFRTSRLQRGQRPQVLDPVERAAAAVARPGDDRAQLVRLIRWILERWPRERWPHNTPTEAARAVGMYLAAGGQLGPEAEHWWRREVPALALEHAHTPWRAAASTMHVAPWIAARRQRERLERQELAKDARHVRESERVHATRKTPEQIEAMRIAALGRVR